MRQIRLWVSWAQLTLASGDSERNGLHRIYNNGTVASSKHAQFLNLSNRRLYYDNPPHLLTAALVATLTATPSALVSRESLVASYLGVSSHRESWRPPFSDLYCQPSQRPNPIHWIATRTCGSRCAISTTGNLTLAATTP